MRKVLSLAVLAVALAVAPVSAQQTPTAEELTLIESFIGPPIDQALDICISDQAPDLTSLEARWVQTGWPEFQSMGGWRVSNIPPGDHVAFSFGLHLEPLTESSVPGTGLTCTLLVPAPFGSILYAHLARRFGTTSDRGIFHLDHGALSEQTLTTMPERGVPALFEQTPPEQRLVLLSNESEGQLIAARVSVLHRTQ